MTWREIKTWAESKGYNAKKISDGYAWHLLNNSKECGTSSSVSKLARDILNHMTDNKFKSHQDMYKSIDYG